MFVSVRWTYSVVATLMHFLNFQNVTELGIFLSLTVNDKSASMPTTLSLPVSWGEFETIQTIIKFAIPRFLGFDAVWGDPGLEPMPYEVQPMPPAAPSWKNLD